jgi:uncharacterized membrane protein
MIFASFGFCYAILTTPTSHTNETAYIFLFFVAVGSVCLLYLLLMSTRVHVFFRSGAQASDGSPDNPDEPARAADREEIRAAAQLRRGDITRAHYERIIARRQFAHGDLTRAQFRERIKEIAEEESRATRV